MLLEKAAERRLGREALLAVRAVAEAVDVVRTLERDVAADALWKHDASPVTIADFSVQALVAARLGRDCPADTLVAEEGASALRSEPNLSSRVADVVSQADPSLRPDQILDLIDRGGGSPGRRFWTLDPIDGTKGLLRDGQYAIALALIVDGVVRLGVLGCPRLSLDHRAAENPPCAGGSGGIAVAVRGRRAWWLPYSDHTLRPLAVSGVSDPRQARVLHSFETPHSDVEALRRLVDVLNIDCPARLMDSQAKHAVIAGGEADVLLRFPTERDFHEAIWDEAVGSLLIEEGGGCVTDLAGRRLDFSVGRRLSRNVGLVATNGVLHAALLKGIQHAQAHALPPRA
jgi:3'(2'), 5'-bisphosphate nucleotidase